MTQDELKKLEDKLEGLLVKANQSGKKETSDLVDMIMHKLEIKIEESINKNVNGKIIKLTDKVDNYIISDNEWKERAEPVITMGTNVQGFGKVSLYILGFFASVAGAIFAIMHFISDKYN